jgi:DNA-binding NarL/FixJ family response regulator
MIEVLIIDDHPVMRELLHQILETYPDLCVVGDAATGEEGLIQASRFQPAVALIDVHLPTMSGIEVAKLMKRQNPSTAIIGLTAGEPNEMDMTMIAAGASAVINKADLLSVLYRSITEAVKQVKVPGVLKRVTLSRIGNPTVDGR